MPYTMPTSLTSSSGRMERRSSLVWFKNEPKSTGQPLAKGSQKPNAPTFPSPCRDPCVVFTLCPGPQISSDRVVGVHPVSRTRPQVSSRVGGHSRRTSIVWFAESQTVVGRSTPPNKSVITPSVSPVKRKPAIGFVENGTVRVDKVGTDNTEPPFRSIRRKPAMRFRQLSGIGPHPATGGSARRVREATPVCDAVEALDSDPRAVHRRDALAALEGRRHAITIPMGEEISFKLWVAQAGAPLVAYYGRPQDSIPSTSSDSSYPSSYSSSSSGSSVPPTPLTPSTPAIPIPSIEPPNGYKDILNTQVAMHNLGFLDLTDGFEYVHIGHEDVVDGHPKYKAGGAKSKNVFRSLGRKLKAPFKFLGQRFY